MILFSIGKVNLSIKFAREVKEFFGQWKSISHHTFHKTQLDSIPEPVQLYFNRILKEITIGFANAVIFYITMMMTIDPSNRFHCLLE